MIKQPRQKNEAHPLFEDLAGRRFGRLVAVSYQGKSGRNAAWFVRCDCGTEKIVKSTNLKRQQSCGCLVREQMSARKATHGLTRVGRHHPLYVVWDGMKRRCHSVVDVHPRYGTRGIVVCDRWRFGEEPGGNFDEKTPACKYFEPKPVPPSSTE